MFSIFYAIGTNGLRYWRWGGVDSVREQKKLEARKMLQNAAESPASSAPHQHGGRSFFPKETPQRRWIDKVYSEMAGLEAVQRIGDAHSRSPAVHLGCRLN